MKPQQMHNTKQCEINQTIEYNYVYLKSRVLRCGNVESNQRLDEKKTSKSFVEKKKCVILKITSPGIRPSTKKSTWIKLIWEWKKVLQNTFDVLNSTHMFCVLFAFGEIKFHLRSVEAAFLYYCTWYIDAGNFRFLLDIGPIFTNLQFHCP